MWLHAPVGEVSMRCRQMMYATPNWSQFATWSWTIASPRAASDMTMKSSASPAGWPFGSAAPARVPLMVRAAAPGTSFTTAFAAAATCGCTGPAVLVIWATADCGAAATACTGAGAGAGAAVPTPERSSTCPGVMTSGFPPMTPTLRW
jgi:hypothetical protein